MPYTNGNITCTRRIQFCAGHRVMEHESKCRHVHGHNYVVYITAQTPKLDKQGRVIDFSFIKELFGGWIDRNWDHGFIRHKDDYAVLKALSAFEIAEATEAEKITQKQYPLPYNPTAENMARYLGEEVPKYVTLPENVSIVKVVVCETENCSAEWVAVAE